MAPDAPFLMGLCFLNGAEPGGLYRKIGRQRRYEASLCAIGAIMRAFCPRGPFANIRMVSHSPPGGGDRTRDDNGAIIKMKRAGHSLAGAERSAAEFIRRGIARNENAHARSRRVIRNFLFTDETDVDVFLARQFPFFALYRIPEIRILFRRVALYLARHSARGLIYDKL